MNYVEWLRVRNALRIFAIILGILIVVALIVRISIAPQMNSDQFIINKVSREPGTTVSHSVVDGLNRTTIFNAHDRVTITIDQRPDGGRMITVTEPSKSAKIETHDVFGSVDIHESSSSGTETTRINTDGPVDFAIFLGFACFAALIFATVFGGSLACEQPHLEIALTKPVTRERYALGTIGVDLAGIALAALMTIVAAIVCQAMFEVPHFNFDHTFQLSTLLFLVLPLAWYAMLNAATTSMKRGVGVVLGFAWPVAFVVIALSHIPLGDTAVGQAFHAIFWTVSRFLPLSYFPEMHGNSAVIPAGEWGYVTRIAIASGLMLIYGALAVVQWRRVEA
ncbi:MAG TPA: hypothetical protein VMV65_03455 [Alphaproteobacteria bacterium]|nr:hypothetical protein [Alphaproteobacteria bacterium]